LRCGENECYEALIEHHSTVRQEKAAAEVPLPWLDVSRQQFLAAAVNGARCQDPQYNFVPTRCKRVVAVNAVWDRLKGWSGRYGNAERQSPFAWKRGAGTVEPTSKTNVMKAGLIVKTMTA